MQLSKKTLLLFIPIVLLIIISIILIVLQFTQPQDLFSSQSSNKNQTKVVPSDYFKSFDEPKVSILIPKGMQGKITSSSKFITIEIANDDCNIFFTLNDSQKNPIGSDSGFSFFSPVFTTTKDNITKEGYHYVSTEKQIVRNNTLSEFNAVQYFHVWNSPLNNNTNELSGFSTIHIADIQSKSSSKNVSITATLQSNLTEQQKQDYLQIADRVVLSIQDNE